MAITYDPDDGRYRDEADVRSELTRVFDICDGCRRCVELCAVFPTLFEMMDRNGHHDAGRLTPAQQDEVVDECVQCKRCFDHCPYTPALHEWKVDIPRTMLRAAAMQYGTGIVSLRSKARLQITGRADLFGTIATSMSSLANRLSGAQPPFAKQRFSTWFAERSATAPASTPLRGAVTLYPTCVVEYRDPAVGRTLVERFDADRVDCSLSDAGCCGAPWLHAGHVGRFTKIARKNVTTLAAEIRRGSDVVVPPSLCRHVLRTDYPDHVEGPDAELVAAHTFDAAEWLSRPRAAGDGA